MSQSKTSVLFVDDDAVLMDGVRRSLHGLRERWDMTFVSDPLEALDLYSNAPRDVVVSDLDMPEMDGLMLVQTMMAQDTEGRSRFIFLTGGGDFDSAIKAINELHVYRFLRKPIVRDVLVEAIEEAFDDIWSENAIGGRHAAAALEMINTAVLVLDPKGWLLFANPAGKRLLEQHGGLTLGRDNVCRAATSDQTRDLHRMFADCTADREDRVRWLTLAVDAWSPPMNFAAVPRGEPGNRTVILMSSSPNAASGLSSEAVQHLFGLSPAEANLTVSIARGDRLEEAADANGLTISSARTYLKRVFAKTGASRQSDLVKLILTSPAMIVKQA